MDNAEAWPRLKGLLGDAIEMDAAAREAFLADLDAREPSVAAALRSLLRSHEDAGEFLETLVVPDGGSTRPDPFAASEEPETRIGPYKILSKLGEGGFGVVHLAEQERPVRRRVAIKIVKLGMDSREVVARFEAERQALALMDHPNVAKVFDAGTTERGRPYFAMEYVPGVPITEYCDQNRLTTRERLELFIAVCMAVQHAHTKGVIHRDLKPGNILVTVQDGRAVPKVIDFGVAKAVSIQLTQRTLFTEQGRLIGTPEYMSPEQAGTTGLDVDTRTDVYSLGVILYELLVGTLPFASRTLREAGFEGIVRMIREKDPPKPSTRLSSLSMSVEAPRAADTPPSREPTADEIAARRRADLRSLAREIRGDLDWITMRAMEKDRTRRYQTPAELAEDVRRFLASEPVTARPPSVTYRAHRFVRRHRMGVTFGGILAAAVFLAVGGTAVGFVRARAAEAQMKRERDEARLARTAAEEAREAERAQREIAEAQRQRAEREAAKAQAVREFLTEDLLGAVTPERTLGKKITVEELLANAAARVGEAFVGKPELEGAIRTHIGTTYFQLGLLDEADAQWTAAYEVARGAFGEEHEDTVGAMSNLALLRQTQGRFDEALPLYERCAVLMPKVKGPEHPITATAMSNYALFLYRIGKLAEAERIGREALDLASRLHGEDHPETLRMIGTVAATLLNRGETAEAEKMFRRSHEIRLRVFGEDHPETLISMGNLAAVMQRDPARVADSLAMYRDLVERASRVLGQEHPNTLIWMSNLAAATSLSGAKGESESLYRRTLEIRRRVSGDEHPDTAQTLNSLAGVLADLGKTDEAEAAYREVLATRRKIFPAEHPDTAMTLAGLGGLLATVGRAAEAEPLIRESLDIRAAVLGETHGLTEVSRSLLGEALGALGRDEEAERLLVSSYEALKADGRIRANFRQDALDRLVRFYESRGREADAERRRADARVAGGG